MVTGGLGWGHAVVAPAGWAGGTLWWLQRAGLGARCGGSAHHAVSLCSRCGIFGLISNLFLMFGIFKWPLPLVGLSGVMRKH